MVGFRATRVEQDGGFIEYIVVLQHRESWQNIGAILNSKAEVTSFTLEVAKQLGMRYRSPPLPVSLNMGQDVDHTLDQQTTATDFSPTQELRAMFQQTNATADIDGDDD